MKVLPPKDGALGAEGGGTPTRDWSPSCVSKGDVDSFAQVRRRGKIGFIERLPNIRATTWGSKKNPRHWKHLVDFYQLQRVVNVHSQ